MKILQAELTDVAAICALVNSAYRGDTSRKGWTTEADLLDGIRIDEQMLEDYIEHKNSCILKCVDDANAIIGCVYLKQEREHLYLGMLTVLPELQAKGIGKLLLRASEERARQKGCKSIVMTVITSRTELIEWYKRHGYKETGEKQPFPKSERFGKPKQPLEFLVMEKSL
ncbi:GNAT family N-acetyltransferase [Segetibacter aerophilus]|uniref:N-acetyltransferase n=1 Tax=Segetibacter aerophilus TaxID=670293 RepID=A0A512BAE1_9BACT|nr:GNAT family N-acetyltransferase [Segetibacter aerophilus]GEO08926.1 N-acetyltransferase [Segetibacter aerophilus]